MKSLPVAVCKNAWSGMASCFTNPRCGKLPLRTSLTTATTAAAEECLIFYTIEPQNFRVGQSWHILPLAMHNYLTRFQVGIHQALWRPVSRIAELSRRVLWQGADSQADTPQASWIELLRQSGIICVATYQTAFTARQPFEMEYRLRRADAVYRWVLDRGVPLGEPEGGLVGYIGSAIDITELRHAQEELERRVQERTTALARAQEEIRRFTGMVSKDLRAPLITLQGFANELHASWDVLQATLPALLPHLEASQRADVSRALGQDITEALGFIETAVTRLDHLIGAMLEVAHLGRHTLHYAPLDMPALVQGVLRTLAPSWRRTGCR